MSIPPGLGWVVRAAADWRSARPLSARVGSPARLVWRSACISAAMRRSPLSMSELLNSFLFLLAAVFLLGLQLLIMSAQPRPAAGQPRLHGRDRLTLQLGDFFNGIA